VTSPPRNRTARRIILATIAVALVALVVDAVYLIRELPTSARATVTNMRSGRDRLEDIELSRAGAEFRAAAEAAARTESLLQHPAALVARLVPKVGGDAVVLRDLARAAHAASSAGVEVVDAADRLGANEEQGLASAVYKDGRVRVEALERAAPSITTAASLLREALAAADGSRVPFLSPLRAAREEAIRLLRAAESTASRAASAFDLLPGMVGGSEQRRYFLMFQAPSEARATGGLLGFYGILTADEGRLDLGRLGPIHELSTRRRFGRFEAPDWYRDLYGPVGALREWRQVNTSINFPQVAQVVLQMYERSTGDRLDGVIAMDPIALGELTRATGKLDVGLGPPIGPNNARRVLLRQIYEDFENRPEAQNAYLAAIIQEFWSRVGSGVDARRFIDALGVSAARGNLKVFSARAPEQGELTDLRADGRYPPGNTQAVFHNNATANKVDYFLRRTQRTRIVVNDDGSLRVRLEVTLRNRADSALNRALLVGPGVVGDDPAVNAMSLFLLLPEDAIDARVEVDDTDQRFLAGRDDRSPVLWDLIQIPGQATRRVVCTYEIAPRRGRVNWTLYPQVLAHSDAYSVQVVNAGGEPIPVEGATQGLLDRPQTISFTIP
jgi:hypothetical protein